MAYYPVPWHWEYYPDHSKTGWVALVGFAATKVPSAFLVVVVAVDDDHQTIADYYYCYVDRYEMAVLAAGPRNDYHDCPNDFDSYCYCDCYGNSVDTMTITRGTTDCDEAVPNDAVVHDGLDDDSVGSGGGGYDSHHPADSWTTTMTIFSRTVHPACIDSISPSSRSQSSGSGIARH